MEAESGQRGAELINDRLHECFRNDPYFQLLPQNIVSQSFCIQMCPNCEYSSLSQIVTFLSWLCQAGRDSLSLSQKQKYSKSAEILLHMQKNFQPNDLQPADVGSYLSRKYCGNTLIKPWLVDQ